MEHLLTASVFLSVVSMTTAASTPKVYGYVFEIETDEPLAEIKASFQNATMDSVFFKSVGEHLYYAITSSNDVTAQRNLTLPEFSYVTQFPFEKMEKLGKIFGVPCQFTFQSAIEEISDKNAVLTLAEWDLDIPEGTSLRQFYEYMTKALRELQKISSFALSLNILSRYPPKIFTFANLHGQSIDVNYAQQSMGTAGVFKSRIRNIVVV